MIRTRLIVFVAVLAAFGSLPALTPFAHAQPEDPDQTEQQEEETGGKGQKDPETQVGEEEGGAVKEEGPPWTYQMVWITLFLLLLVFLGIGGAYYRFVVQRQRGGV